MMGNDFTDKVTEYRILNEQLMSKALALLKTADDLMINTASDVEEKILVSQDEIIKKPKKYCENIENSIAELTETFSNIDLLKESDLLTENDTDTLNDNSFENKAFEDFIKTKDKIKNKFSFLKNSIQAKNGLLEFTDELDTSMDDVENGEIKGIKNMFSHQKESDMIMKNFLNTKFTLQTNLKNNKVENINQSSKINDQCVKVLKFKIESLENDIKVNQENLKKKTSESDKFSKENQSLLEGKAKLNAQINALKSQIVKRDEKIFNLNSKIQSMENEFRSVKNEHETLLKATKETAQDISSIESKYLRATKEMSILKETLNAQKNHEKEQKETYRKQIDELTSGIKTAEKREKNYEAALKKQILLIDNLRKQIAYLTASKTLDNTEKQLESVLKLEVNK